MSAWAHRRIVVGATADGRSTVVLDASDLGRDEQASGRLLEEIWRQDAVPGRLDDSGVRLGMVSVDTPERGAVVRILTIPPVADGTTWRADLHGDDVRHVLTMLVGAVDLILEDGEVTLETGDSVVLSGHVHDWRNTSDAPVSLVLTSIPLLREQASAGED